VVQAYSDKIKHESLRIAVCGMIESALMNKNGGKSIMLKE